MSSMAGGCCGLILLGLEIVMPVFGIVFLVRGRVSLTSTRAVTGTPARVIGCIFLLPLLAAMLAIMIEGPVEVVRGGPDAYVFFVLPALAVPIPVLFFALIVALIYGRPASPTAAAWDGEEDRVRQLRRAWDEDAPEDEDRPGRRPGGEGDRDRGDEHVQSEDDRARRRPRDEDDRDRGDEHIQSKD
jgi:hypothetical protein